MVVAVGLCAIARPAFAESVGPTEHDGAAPSAPATTPPAESATAPAAAPAAAPAPTVAKGPPPIELLENKMGKRMLTWDANIDGAYGYIFGSKKTDTGFVRLRGGLLWVRDPNFFSVGLT